MVNSRKDDDDDDEALSGVALFQFQLHLNEGAKEHVPPVERERTFPDVVFGTRFFLAAEEGVPIRGQ